MIREALTSFVAVSLVVAPAAANAETRTAAPLQSREAIAANPWIPWVAALAALVVIILVVTDDDEPESP